MDFINPNPLCCHLTSLSSLNTLSFHNNSTALALVRVACRHTHTHAHTHTLLTAGSDIWYCQHSLPQRSEQYLKPSHCKVKPNGASTGVCVRVHPHTHTYPICILIHSTDPRLFAWLVISSVTQWHGDMRKAAQYHQCCCAVKTESLVICRRVMLYKPSVRCTIPSHIIIWQGRQQCITPSTVQCVSSMELIAPL